ncbi:MAG: hypothetical protein ACSLFE_09585 [Gemmatimonadaceae bacterium]
MRRYTLRCSVEYSQEWINTSSPEGSGADRAMAAESPEFPAAAQNALADRYRIERELGRGGRRYQTILRRMKLR